MTVGAWRYWWLTAVFVVVVAGFQLLLKSQCSFTLLLLLPELMFSGEGGLFVFGGIMFMSK